MLLADDSSGAQRFAAGCAKLSCVCSVPDLHGRGQPIPREDPKRRRCSSGLAFHGRATGGLAPPGAVVIQLTVGHEPCSRPARCRRRRRRHRAGRESIGGVASSQLTTAPGGASPPVASFQPCKFAAAPEAKGQTDVFGQRLPRIAWEKPPARAVPPKAPPSTGEITLGLWLFLPRLYRISRQGVLQVFLGYADMGHSRS